MHTDALQVLAIDWDTQPRLAPLPFALALALALLLWLVARVWLVHRFDARHGTDGTRPPRTPGWVARLARWPHARPVLWGAALVLSIALALALRGP